MNSFLFYILSYFPKAKRRHFSHWNTITTMYCSQMHKVVFYIAIRMINTMYSHHNISLSIFHPLFLSIFLCHSLFEQFQRRLNSLPASIKLIINGWFCSLIFVIICSKSYKECPQDLEWYRRFSTKMNSSISTKQN